MPRLGQVRFHEKKPAHFDFAAHVSHAGRKSFFQSLILLCANGRALFGRTHKGKL